MPPIYEYRCENGHTQDFFAGREHYECRICGLSMKRVYSPPAIHFKGKGFHNTDYRKKEQEDESTGS